MLAKLLIVTGLVSAGLLFVILTMTTPETGGALAILAVFLLTYCIFISLTTFVLWVCAKIISRISSSVVKRTVNSSLSLRKAYYYSSVIALALVIIISLQSIGRVGVYEVGLIIIFVILGCLYVTKRSA
ncbi:MAG: hypothetical protein WAW80_00700 [Candidatus Saccharimonadales bacterium]